jgi:hypothetical protein
VWAGRRFACETSLQMILLAAISAVEFSFLAHPRCRRFENLPAAVSAVMAQRAGEEARTLALLVGERGRVA